MLAVMVDLGWPWWVTTLIAAGVALVAALAFIGTRRATIRAVAALVLVEAIAIGAIAPFVMEDFDDSNGGSAMSSAPLGRDEFAQKADANCSELSAFIATLGNPKTPAGVERMMDRMLPRFWGAIVAQQDLQPPPKDEAKATQWMHAMAAYGRDFESLRASASRRDPGGMQRANANADAHAKESARLSKELGMRVCFQ